LDTVSIVNGVNFYFPNIFRIKNIPYQLDRIASLYHAELNRENIPVINVTPDSAGFFCDLFTDSSNES